LKHPKVSIGKTKYLVPDNHTTQDWVDHRKKKRIVHKELMVIKPTLRLQNDNNNTNQHLWTDWKKRHLFSSYTWDFLLSHPKTSFFSKRLTNDTKLKRGKDLGVHYVDEATLF